MDRKIVYVIAIVAIVGMCLVAFILVSGQADEIVLASKAQYTINNELPAMTPQQLASINNGLNNYVDNNDRYNNSHVKTGNDTIIWLKSLDPGEYICLPTHNTAWLVMKHSDYNRIKEIASKGSNITVAGYVEKTYPALGGGIDVIVISNVELVKVE